MKTFKKFLTEATNWYFKDLNYNKLSMDSLNTLMKNLVSKINELTKLHNEKSNVYNEMWNDGLSEDDFRKLVKKTEELEKKYSDVWSTIKSIDTLNLFGSGSNIKLKYEDWNPFSIEIDYRNKFEMWKLFFAKCYEKKFDKETIVKMKEKICDIFDKFRNTPAPHRMGINFDKNDIIKAGDSFDDTILKNRNFYTGNVLTSRVFVNYRNSSNKVWDFMFAKKAGRINSVPTGFGGYATIAIVYRCSVDIKTAKVISVDTWMRLISDPNKTLNNIDTLKSISNLKRCTYEKFIKLSANKLKYPPIDLKTGEPVKYDWKGRHPNDPEYEMDDHGYFPGNPYYNPDNRPWVYD